MPFIGAPGQPTVSQVTSSFAPVSKSGISENAIAQNFAWTGYGQSWGITSHYGAIDSEGNYWQPDVNVGAPGRYPITNLLPGTVTSVQNTSWGQNVVTVKLDNALNSLATHTFYEHLSSANVSPGQHLASGTLIGYNNPDGQVPVGFGFYSGDVYGSGPEWNTLQQDLAPGGKGLLKADWLINNFKNGKGPSGASINQYSQSQSLPQNAPSCGLLDFPCVWNNYILPFFEKIFVFIIALILIILGFFLIAEPQAKQLASKLVP
jgi:hypothetical protein